MIQKRFTGDSENDLKINIFLKVGESDVDLDADADSDADTDVVFKDPALYIKKGPKKSRFLIKVALYRAGSLNTTSASKSASAQNSDL